MKCPECQGEVPALHFYCPHCRAEMPLKANSELAYAAEKAAQSDQKERGTALRHQGPPVHSRRLYEIGWQTMQWIVTLGIFGGAFAAYQHINWRNAAERINAAKSDAASAVEATEAPTRATRRNARAKANRK